MFTHQNLSYSLEQRLHTSSLFTIFITVTSCTTFLKFFTTVGLVSVTGPPHCLFQGRRADRFAQSQIVADEDYSVCIVVFKGTPSGVPHLIVLTPIPFRCRLRNGLRQDGHRNMSELWDASAIHLPPPISRNQFRTAPDILFSEWSSATLKA